MHCQHHTLTKISWPSEEHTVFVVKTTISLSNGNNLSSIVVKELGGIRTDIAKTCEAKRGYRYIQTIVIFWKLHTLNDNALVLNSSGQTNGLHIVFIAYAFSDGVINTQTSSLGSSSDTTFYIKNT